ncbi:unnamed protein product [Symbiodinium pilosum]|uniref:Uncharacterized protein n=1 Tax=Symbiodinium pilosum TaxID=2952 RepID=A0A812JMJ7_SYMPI|nr:unnamed protein product [Symbiodinium pilosum]
MVTTDEGNEFNTLQMVLGLRIGKAAGRQGLHGSLIKMLKKDLAGEGGNVMTMLHTLQHQTARRGLTDDAAVENNGSVVQADNITASQPRVAFPELSFLIVPRRKGLASAFGPFSDCTVTKLWTLVRHEEKVDAIALAAADTDFLFLLEQLQGQGICTLALLPTAVAPGVSRAFASVAEVERFQMDGLERCPTKKIVLHRASSSVLQPMERHLWQPTGVSRIEDLDPEQFGAADQATAQSGGFRVPVYVAKRPALKDQPLLPAVAKLFATLGKAFTAWPKRLAFAEAVQEMFASGSSWEKHIPRWVFVLPCGTQVATKKWLEACGSLKGVEFIRGGGARLFVDSVNLVPEVLHQLGYFDDELNEDLSEAIDVFADMKGNSKVLAASGVSIKPDYPVHTKQALLHAALVSPKLHGEWQLAPSDDLVRGHLLAHGWIRRRSAPCLDVFAALKRFCESTGLPHRRTYRGAVKEFSNHLTKVDPRGILRFGACLLGTYVLLVEGIMFFSDYAQTYPDWNSFTGRTFVHYFCPPLFQNFRAFKHFGPEPPSRELDWVPRVCTELYEGPHCSNVTHWKGTVRLEIDNHVIEDVHMHSRGHSSAMFPKHQFSLKLPKQMPLLGMAPARRWVLATSFVDVSFQRNPTAFEVYRKLGGWATDTVYVNLEWHGVDYGLYYIGERVECGGGRLDSCQTLPGRPEASDFLLTIDWAKAGKVAIRSNVTETFFSVLYPVGALEASSHAFLRNLIDSVDSLAASGKPEELLHMLDFQSFVRYFVVEELAKDVDGYAFSNYVMVRQGKLMHAAPWDFDLAFDFACMPRYFTNVFTGNASLGVVGWNVENARSDALWIGPSGIPGGSVKRFGINKRQLFLNIWRYPGFKAAFATAWKAARGRMLGDAMLVAMVRRRSKQISSAANLDLDIWRRTNRCGFWRCCAPDDTHSFKKASEHLANYLVSRAHWIDENIDALLD